MRFSRRQLVHTRDLLVELVVREMKLRYERSSLGMLWAVLNPLLQIAIFTFVFDAMFHVAIPHYPAFIFTGLLAWNWFREGITATAGAIVSNRELVRQPGFPTAVLPIVAVAVPLLDLLAALPVLLVVLALSGIPIHATVLLVPALLVLQFLLLQGIGFVLASLQVTFRDVQHLLGVSLSMLFYLTPVFYSPTMVPGWAHAAYALNPMMHLLTAYRGILMDGTLPNWTPLLAIAVLDGILLRVGWAQFARARMAFVEEL
jgi:homopolymeric O-antigen transport system permease protein